MNLYSFLLNKIVLPVGDFLFNGNYLKTLKQWNNYDRLSEEKLLNIQEEQLKKILKYAIKTVPFYQNIKYQETQSPYQNLKNFPVLTKDILRKQANSLISSKYDITRLDKNHSSGSSGIQSFTYMSKRHKFYLRALQTHWFSWSGYTPGDKILQYGMSPKRPLVKKLKDFFYRVLYINSFFLSEEEILSIAKKSSQKKIRFIAGYPSELNELAKFSYRNNIEYQVQGIITFGDKLFPHYINNFKKAFGSNLKVIDTYGCAEGILMACRKDLEYYYVMTPHVFLEIVDDIGEEVAEGQIGHVLVTCLTNKAMPIIRYKLGDMAVKLPKHKYPKNRMHNYPLLEKIIGRDTDYVETIDGTRIFVTTFVAILEFYPEIKQFKIVQNKLSEIIVLYSEDSPDNMVGENILNKVKNEIDNLTKNNLNIVFNKVDVIPTSPSGKPKIIESLL